MSAANFLKDHLAGLTEGAKASDLHQAPAGTPGPANAPVQANAAMTNIANGLQAPTEPKPAVNVPGQSLVTAPALDHLSRSLSKALTPSETGQLMASRDRFPKGLAGNGDGQPADDVSKRNYVKQQGSRSQFPAGMAAGGKR